MSPPLPSLASRTLADYRLDRPIGRGAYGEVWLAWNACGHPYALKAVRRTELAAPQPFDREFAGIRRYEPLSRTHPNLVPILHVGRDDSLDLFYYVMELADPVDPDQGPTHPGYEPRTLRSDMRRVGRLPVGDCLAHGAALADALQALHASGLVHRDVKPSNIIFVRGVLKLADIGLVAARDEARSFVGTEGFIPPEGPGTPAADVFALGRLLYEISTGKDRTQYPEPPTELGQLPEREGLLRLNAVLRVACHPNPARRHVSARELGDDLRAIANGRPRRPGGRVARRRMLRGFANLGAIACGAWAVRRLGWIPEASLHRPDSRAVALVAEAENLSPTTKEGFSAILAKCHAALELEPRYAPAHAILANAYRESAGWYRAEHDAMLEARRAARRALELDPRLVGAHTQLALIHLLSDWDFAGAEAYFRSGLALDPGHLGHATDYTNFLRSMGRTADARRMLEPLLHRQDPRPGSPQTIRIEHALLLYTERRFDDMLQVTAELRAAKPGLLMCDLYEGLAFAASDRMEAALAAFERARKRDDGPDLIALCGLCLARLGRASEARMALDRLRSLSPIIAVSPYYPAYVHAGFRDTEQVLRELHRAVDARSGSVVGYAWRGLIPDALWDPFRTDPRWPGLLRRVGLPDPPPLKPA